MNLPEYQSGHSRTESERDSIGKHKTYCIVRIMDTVQCSKWTMRLNGLELCWSEMILPVVITQFELTAHTGFLEFLFMFVEFFEVVEIAGTCLISTLENSADSILFPPV